MREIKFRAWDKENKKMFEPSELVQEPNLVVGYLDSSGCPKTYDNIELMQFTGLQDKNGKDIYEEDIIKRTSLINGQIREIKEIVRWEIGFSFVGFPITSSYEIIGNVFENPELLEGK